jgi:hypothetical protein
MLPSGVGSAAGAPIPGDEPKTMTNPPQVPQPGVPLPQGPPPPPNRALWWVLGTIIALLVLIIGGGLFFALHLARDITVKGPNDVELRTPAGEVSIHKTGADNTGLPVYPGATLRPEGARIQFEPSNKEAGFGLAAASYLTPASLDQVASWYRKNLDPSFHKEKGKDTVDIGDVNVGHADLAFVSHQENRMRIVALERRGDKTKISLVRMGRQEPQ